MKLKKVLDIIKSISDLLKNKMKSILMISLLVLKYLVLYLLTRYYHFEQNDNLVLICFVSLLIIDLLVLVKEKNIIFNKNVNLLKYLINYMSLSIVSIDCSLLISCLVGDKYTVMFMRVVSILLYIYILIDFMLLPTKISKLKKNENFLLREKVKVIIVYWSIPLIIFYNILNSYDEIFIPFFSGVIYVFFKWFYSKDFIVFMNEKTKNKIIPSRELETLNSIKIANITILFIAINSSTLIMKIYGNQILCILKIVIVKIKLILSNIFNISIVLNNFNLPNKVVSNLLSAVLVIILYFIIKIIILKKGLSYIQKYNIENNK